MEKAQKNKLLTSHQKKFNKLISEVRYKIEQDFGTLKRKFMIARSSYFTTAKVKAQLLLKAMAFKMLKAISIAKLSYY